MAEITAALVKQLRETSGAGMMDCKKALTETGGDIEAAVDWLRKKGLATAAKKAGRVAAEGLVGVAVRGNSGAVVEVNAETDFVARNESFQAFVAAVAGLAIDHGDLASLNAAAFPGSGKPVKDQLTDLIAGIGENMTLRRVETLAVASGVLASYVHNGIAPGLGRIGVLVALETKGAAGNLGGLARNLAMHVAAAAPQAIGRDGVDPSLLERERAVLADQARASGKPEAIIEKMVEGRLRKFYEEVCLLEQTYVIDGESKVADVLAAAAKEVGAAVSVTGFRLVRLGEGIVRRSGDFAAEVAAAAGR